MDGNGWLGDDSLDRGRSEFLGMKRTENLSPEPKYLTHKCLDATHKGPC